MGKITIGKKEFNTEERILDQNELYFYEENPRIYSIIHSDGEPPIQVKIEEALQKMDHVKKLRVAIEQNGGVTEPLLVMLRNDKYYVIEGNSRLAAYRALAEKNPIKWRTVKCNVILDKLTDDDIFTLLGQYHLISRKDWSKFEQAAYLYRKKESSNIENDILAKSVGLSKATVENYLKVYKFMREYDDLRPEKWSYYEEYLKNRAISNVRRGNIKLDETFVSQVKSGAIREAIDVRKLLGSIAKGNDKTSKKIMQSYIEGELSLYDAYERLEATGKIGDAYTRIKKFREILTDNDFQKKIELEAVSSKDIIFELKKIKQITEKLLKNIGE